jgi:hypothetical protein
MMPELRCREVPQSGVQRPASKSSSARFPAASKRPPRMSASICRSHWSAANSSNHSRKRANSTAERCETAASRSSTLSARKTIDRVYNCKSLPPDSRSDSNEFVTKASSITGCTHLHPAIAGLRRGRPAFAKASPVQAWRSDRFTGWVLDKQIEVVNK